MWINGALCCASLCSSEIRKVVALERKQRSCVPADVKTRVVRHTVAGQRQLITGSLRDYDEKRECWVCKHPCFLSAIICTCSITRVVCPDHHDRLCECASKNKLLLMWETDDAMQNTIDKLERFDNAQLTNMSPAAAVRRTQQPRRRYCHSLIIVATIASCSLASIASNRSTA